jgi:translocation and assembly module TamB
VDLTRPGSQQSFRDLNLELSLTVKHLQQSRQTVQVHRADLALTTDQGRFALKTSLTYNREGLDLRSLALVLNDRSLTSLAGAVRLKGEEPEVNLAAELGPALAEGLRGLWTWLPAGLELGGKWQLRGTPSQLQVSGEGTLNGASYSLTGQVRPKAAEVAYELALNLTGLSPELLATINPAWAPQVRQLEPLTVRLGLKGAGLRWPPPQVEWTLESRPFRYQQARVEQLSLSLKGGDPDQRLEGLLRGNFGQLKVAAQGRLLSSLAGEMKVQGEGVKPELLGLPALAGSQLNGKFTGNVRLPGGLRVSGDLEAQGQLAGQPLKELKGRLSWEGARLEVPQARVQWGGLNAELKGSLAKAGVELNYRGQLTADGAVPWLPAGWRGRLEGEGALKGPWASPQFTLQAKGQGLAAEGVALESFRLKAAGTGWPPPGGSLELNGTGLRTPMGIFSQVRLNSQGEGNRWRFDLHAATPQGPQAELKGAADLRERPLSILIDRCHWRFKGMSGHNAAPVQVRFLPGWEVAPATFRVNGGTLTFQGRAREGQLTGRLEVSDLPPDPLCLMGSPCQGKVKGQLTLSGDPRQPLIQGQFTWGPGKWGEFAFQFFTTSLTFRDNRLSLNGSLAESAQGPRLNWEGQIPLNLSLYPLAWSLGERDLRFRVQGEGANLALLTALSPEVQSAEGSVDIMAEWTGNPRHPQVSGHIRWGAGFLHLRQTGLPYRLAPGQARLQGERLLIPEINLESGGTARFSGEITLTGYHPQQVTARGQLQDFVVLRRGGSEAAGTGNLTLTGPWSGPVLKGNLLVSRAVFQTGFFRSDQHPDITLMRAPPPAPPPGPAGPNATPTAFYRDLQMDVALEATGGVWLRNKNLNVEIAGKLKAAKRSGQPTLVAGRLQSLKGTYILQGRTFKVERGLIRLPGNPKEDSILEGRATHEMQGVTLILNATGAASKPTVRLESIPPLPASDLLAYLVFGRPSRSLTREEYASVGQQAAGIVGGLTAEKIKDLLGKDFPLVGGVTLRASQTGDRPAVGVTTPITKDLSVSFERKYDPLHRDNTEQVILEYRINRRLSLESQMGRRNTGADVLFNLDF